LQRISKIEPANPTTTPTRRRSFVDLRYKNIIGIPIGKTYGIRIPLIILIEIRNLLSHRNSR